MFGARSNFEGGPSALAAGLTGRTPRYGYHLDEHRRPTRHFRLAATPRDLGEWGALGGIVGRACGSYWEVPLIEGVTDAARLRRAEAFRRGAGELRLGRAVPHARHHRRGEHWDRRHLPARRPKAGNPKTIDRADIDAFVAAYGATGDKVDVVVFAAPQLSLIEMAEVADALDGRQRACRHDRCWSRPRPRSSTPPTAWG